MIRRSLVGLSGAAALVLCLVPAVAAQDRPAIPTVEGLNNPRHIAFHEDMLYIAEAGTGGTEEVQGMFGPALRGETGRVIAVAPDGGQTVVVDGLPSVNEAGEVSGLNAVAFFGDEMWIAGLDGGRASYVRQIDPADGSVLTEIDTLAAETALNPDASEIIESNPVDLARVGVDGTLYIADAAANTVWQWNTGDEAPSVFATWTEGNPVPTSVALDADGNVWIGFLTGFPFPQGGSRVEVRSPDGELVQTYEGFSTIVDLLAANDTVYAVQFASFGETGWAPFTGSVVDVLSGETYAAGLNLPYGLAGDATRELMIALNSAYTGDGTGVVVAFDAAQALSEAMMAEMGPAATPEAGG